MKKHLFLWLGLLCFNIVIGQELAFSFVGTDPAYCRTAGYQNGNGVVYGSATGGVPAYSFLWTDLTTGETSTNSTWGGRNPGCYELSITDMEGTMITTTVCVDSLNPVANMAVISDDLLGGPIYFTGDAPATVTFENLSLNVPDPVGPDAVIRYYFKPQGVAAAETSINLATDFYYTYEFGGIWTASLVAKNRNGCMDTVFVTFTIDGPSGVEEVNSSEFFTVLPNSSAKQLWITCPQDPEPFTLNVFDSCGNLVMSEALSDPQSTLNFNFPTGIYFYEVIGQGKNEKIKTGKFAF